MMMQSGDGPTIFSAETNPFLRQREGDSISIFGKKIKKKTFTDILGRLSGKRPAAAKSADMEDAEGAVGSEGLDVLSGLSGGTGNPMAAMWEPPGFQEMDGGLSPKARRGGAPVYDPAQIYGGFLSMYGGKKVRGGLLGE